MEIDLNCDMGEGMGNEAELMPYVTSANIATGFHAGNGDIIRKTMDLALKYGVRIGVHPSFRDRGNFGRQEMRLPPEKLYALILEQLIKIDLIAREKGAVIHHVKPHGALYNLAARDQKTAAIIAQAISDFNDSLWLYGLSGSYLISEAKALGLTTRSEVFADRTYQDEGTLTPRSVQGALIVDEAGMIRQVLQMTREGTVTTTSGRIIPVVAETICIHSDSKNAVDFAKRIYQAIRVSVT